MNMIYLLCTLLLCSMSSLQSVIVLCDLGGTFLDVNKMSYAKEELGLGLLVANGLTNGLQFNPQQRIFQTLEKIGGTQDAIRHEASQVPLPKLYCDWMSGAHTDALEIRTNILREVDQLYSAGFFSSWFEYHIIYRALKAMFSAEALVKHLRPIEPMIGLLERIDQKEHSLVAITNWDPHSFPLFLVSPVGQKISKLIAEKDMIVSGYIGQNKPYASFYEHVFAIYGHDMNNYLYIDDNPDNINAARALGISSILYSGDARVVEQELIARGIIKS